MKKTQNKDTGYSELQDKNRTNKKEVRHRVKHIRDTLLSDMLRIPVDVSDAAVKIILTGNDRVWVENYRGILEYTTQKILLQGREQRICIEGNGLVIDYYTEEDMLIRGRIRSLRFDS